MNRNDPIGFFDSGLGGISVLQKTRQLLPGEDYLYYGDSRNAPYGVRPAQEVEALTERAVTYLLGQGVKAIVLACNTATSAAAASLRSRYPQIPIIGTEPALKPAVERHPGGRILVMATAMTLREQKFRVLWEQYRLQAEIIPVAGNGLVELVEQGILEGPKAEQQLGQLLGPYLKCPVDAVVLGCTHYPFLRRPIRKIVGPDTEILDGAGGVARQLQRQLEGLELLQTRTTPGRVVFRNSAADPGLLELSKKLLAYCPKNRS